MIQLPEYIITCITALNNKGYEAYVVGGAIRNAILNLPVHDYDMTTNATPDEMKEVFKHEKVAETGIDHGTITVIIKSHPVEITTYRTETTYHDHRHPDSVNYSHSLMEDCKRRDFTVNAICYHPQEGLIDYFGGVDDLHNHLIKCIGNADDRFDEDALRILRAIRFSTQLSFDVETNTAASLTKNRKLLDFISQERISDELYKILESENCSSQLKQFFLVFIQILPELESLDEAYINQLINYISQSPASFSIRFSLILYIIGKANSQSAIALANIVMSRMRYSNIIIKKVISILSNYENPLNTKELIKYTLSTNDDCFDRLIVFKKIVEPDFDDTLASNLYNQIRKNNEPYLLAHLAINGRHVQKLGFQNQDISFILNKCLEAVISEEVSNTLDALITYANQFKK